MHRLFFVGLILFIQSCSSFSENQKALLDKKWYCGKSCYISFTSEMQQISFYEGKTSSYEFEFTSDNSLHTISNKENVSDFEGGFFIKDSILVFIEKYEENVNDSIFYHLNEKYERWQTRELFNFGKIISKEDPNPPFIYFQF